MPDYIVERAWPPPDGLDLVEFDIPGVMGTVSFQAVVRPAGREPWLASFRTEDYEGGLTFIETWDFGPMVLACAGGYPHFFRADDPDSRLDLAAYPVLHRLRRNDLVILGDFTTLTAIDGYGLVWESGRLASDELTSLQIGEDIVEGEGNDASTGEWTKFVLSLETGESLH